MPTWLIERGYRFGIVAADCAEAPHVHVTGHGGGAKFWLGPVRAAGVYRYNQGQLGEVTRVVLEHEQEFLRRWHAFCRQAK